MPKHVFGIMQKSPLATQRFVTYEPQKYNYINIDDNDIYPILEDLLGMDCFWHTLQKPEKGLAYTGITLIPPKSMDAFIQILFSKNKGEYIPLISLAKQAKQNGKYIIHFGI